LLSIPVDVIFCRRTNPRIPFRVPIEYDGFERFRPDFTLNLSASGLFVLTPNPLPVGRRLIIRFELPDVGVPVELTGRVTWSPGPEVPGAGKRHPQGMAIAFEPADPDLLAVLDQFVMVTLGLASVDKRIGDELPPHVRRELPIPDEETTVPSLQIDLLFPPDFP
jgi:uncharacterized protein (TIGR02266 family)